MSSGRTRWRCPQCAATAISLCPWTHSYRRDDADLLLFCFAERAHAEQFQQRFGGELIDSKIALVAICRATSISACRTPRISSNASVKTAARSSCASTCAAAAAAGAWPSMSRRVRCAVAPITSCAVQARCSSLHKERSTADPARKSSHRQAPFVVGLAPSQLRPAPVPYSIFLSSAGRLLRN